MVPKHIGIIMDGNRRFAKKLMLKPWKGHEWGAKKLEKVLDWAKEAGVRELTFYAFSIENFNRPKGEFDYLMGIFKKEAQRLLEDGRIDKDKIKIRFIGRLWKFPEELQELMKKVTEKSEKYNDYIINFAVAYGGRAEVIDATKKIAEQVKNGELDVDEINEEVFEKGLYMVDKPDLIIRTSGERRTSGFLLFQGDYAEYFFCDKFWPEFEKEDFLQAIEDYSERHRRFGK